MSTAARSIWLVTLLPTGGCYHSDYTPVRDGRARVVWHRERLEVDFSEVPLSTQCLDALRQELYRRYGKGPAAEQRYEVHCNAELCPDGFWHPSARILDTQLFSPLLPQKETLEPDRFYDRERFEGTLKSQAVDNSMGLVILSTIRLPFGVILFQIMGSLLIMPIFGFVHHLALHTDPIGVVPNYRLGANVIIDAVNLYNDLARSPYTPCSYEPEIEIDK
jgi:hypothetical protein